ncbi:sigma-70 family RNA polymerase sigma factor [Virgibacillus sp. DJP39]|uniref:sigma-70 family RNA polymerase sigma factor n=1 Tax=Virgibacillus sp. DJP39 TaxID=3409790 RepID=UPI003BB5CD47
METIELAKKAINGDEQAFGTLIRSESEKLYKIAMLYVRNNDDALDVIQETVYKAFVSIKQVKEPKYFQSWLTKILIRTCYDLLKKKKKVVYLDDNSLLSQYGGEHSDNTDVNLDLINAVSTLNDDYKTAIILFYFRDLPIIDIADIMKKPENTIKTYLRRAKLELRNLLEGGTAYGQGAL